MDSRGVKSSLLLSLFFKVTSTSALASTELGILDHFGPMHAKNVLFSAVSLGILQIDLPGTSQPWTSCRPQKS